MAGGVVVVVVVESKYALTFSESNAEAVITFGRYGQQGF